jgi:hypothetical protein
MTGTDTTTYPNLGFNPVPGAPDNVERMSSKIATAVGSLAESNQLISRLRDANDSVWQGDAGNAFREHFNNKLAKNLDHAQTSLEKAVGVLGRWHGDLVSFKGRAQQLDDEAAQAKNRQQQAMANYDQAKSNGDIGLGGMVFGDPVSLAQAKTRYDAAMGTLRTAAADLDTVNADLDAIMRRAKDVEGEHHAVGQKAADELAHATDHLAPHKPGGFFHAISSAFSAVGGFIKDHVKAIHSVLSTISAISGFIALVTPPPIDAIAIGVSAVSGAGALACDLADPNFRKQLFSGNVGAIMTAAGDALSVVPGGKIIGSLAKEGEQGVTTAMKISQIAEQPGLLARGISHAPGVSTALAATRLDVALKAANVISSGRHAATTADILEVLLRGNKVVSNTRRDVRQATA